MHTLSNRYTLPSQRPSVLFGRQSIDDASQKQKAEREKMQRIQSFASRYQPLEQDSYIFHNTKLKPGNKLTLQFLNQVDETLNQMGTFDFQSHPETGLLATSATDNWEMGERHWITDGSQVRYWQQKKDPEGWKRSRVVHAATVLTPASLQAIKKTIENPDFYRKGGIMDGVPHIILPKSLKMKPDGTLDPNEIEMDPNWFNQKRLESQALLLLTTVQTLHAGIPNQKGKTKPWGFSPAELDSPKGQLIYAALPKIAEFLIAANTDGKSNSFDFSNTPSASSWEEMPFKKAMTSDAGFAVMAMESLKALLYDIPETEEVRSVREKIKQNAINPDSLSKENLERFIDAGRKFIDERIQQPISRQQDPIQTPSRPYDTSLSLLAAAGYTFDKQDPVSDAAIRAKLLARNAKALRGKIGMRRYNEFTSEDSGKKMHDSYLNRDYHLTDELRQELQGKKSGAGKDYGSKDASTEEDMLARQTLSSPELAAEWGLGESASLQGFAKAKKALLKNIKANGKANKEERTLLKAINQQLLVTLNRNIAAIPDSLPGTDKVLRADGSDCPPGAAMEAFEAVTDQAGQVKYIPGAHTLPWHGAQLYDGLQRAIKAREFEKQLKKDGMLPQAYFWQKLFERLFKPDYSGVLLK